MRRLFIPLLLATVIQARAVNVCFAGDSITAGSHSSPTIVTGDLVAANLMAYTGVSYVAVNQGVGGSNSQDWSITTGNSDLTNAVTEFNSAGGCQSVWFMIGTNDANNAFQTPASTYQTHLQATISYLESHVTWSGVAIVVLSGSPFADSVSYNNSLLVQYQTVLINLAASDTHVRVGDLDSYSLFRSHKTTSGLSLYYTDGVHPAGSPGNIGYLALANLWTRAFLRLFVAPFPPPSASGMFALNWVSK